MSCRIGPRPWTCFEFSAMELLGFVRIFCTNETYPPVTIRAKPGVLVALRGIVVRTVLSIEPGPPRRRPEMEGELFFVRKREEE